MTKREENTYLFDKSMGREFGCEASSGRMDLMVVGRGDSRPWVVNDSTLGRMVGRETLDCWVELYSIMVHV